VPLSPSPIATNYIATGSLWPPVCSAERVGVHTLTLLPVSGDKSRAGRCHLGTRLDRDRCHCTLGHRRDREARIYAGIGRDDRTIADEEVLIADGVARLEAQRLTEIGRY
jgi:hypothetical protein